MKKILFTLLISLSFCSCAVIYGPNMRERAQQLELGMSRQESIDIMGKGFMIESMAQLPEGKLEVLYFNDYPGYLLYFLDGSLSEFHRYSRQESNVSHSSSDESSRREEDDMRINEAISILPLQQNGRTHVSKNIFGDTVVEDSKGNKTTIKKDIFGDTVVEDNKGNKKTVKKDIFGDTIIEDNKGNKTTIKKDIFGDAVVEDNKGNKKTVKKDIFGNTIIEDNKGNKTTIKKDIFGNYTIEN